jgi:hypothetical protein
MHQNFLIAPPPLARALGIVTLPQALPQLLHVEFIPQQGFIYQKPIGIKQDPFFL